MTMGLDPELELAAERARREREAMTPEECVRTAAFIRDSARRLTSERQREIAEEAAAQFDRQAAAYSSGSSSP